MSTRNPDELSLAPSSSRRDFSNVSGGSRATHAPRPDFSNVQGSVRSTEAPLGGVGGGGGSGEQLYTVASGDTLSHIAKRFYGSANKWDAIFQANRDQIDDPDRVFPGQTLRIPAQG